MNVRRIIFLRPGETDWNKQGRWQGWVAAPLNDHGRQQAAMLARFVRNIGIGAFYTSDLRRALQTADMLCRSLGVEPTVDERLRERNIGLWQGLTVDEMKDWYPDEYAQMLGDIEDFRPPSGESRNDVRRRAMSALDDILVKSQYETVAVLSHTTAIKIMLSALVPSYDPLYVNLDNASVTTIHRKEGLWEIAAVNDQMHLEGLAARSMGEIEAHKR